MPARVALVTQWFAPEPSVQPVRIARLLRDAGHDVSILTGIPNYPNGQVSPGYRASQARVESFEGMEVRRTPLYPSHDRSTLGRLLNYASWALSSAALGGRTVKNSDVALVYSSPATAATAAMVAKWRYGIPYVLLVQDVWPDSIFASGFLSGRLRRIAERLVTIFVDRAYKNASAIAVISPGMRTLLMSRGVPADKVVLVYNSTDAEVGEASRETAVTRQDLGLSEGDFVVMYAGNHGAAQDLGSVVEAVQLLPASSRVRLVLLGDGVEKPGLRERVGEEFSSRVIFLPPVARNEVPAYTAMADVQLVALADRPLFSVTMPSKVQAILESGEPMLAVASGDVAHVVNASGAGAVAPPGQPQAIAAQMTALASMPRESLHDMGRAGRSYYETEMAPEVSNARLLEILESAAAMRCDDRSAG